MDTAISLLITLALGAALWRWLGGGRLTAPAVPVQQRLGAELHKISQTLDPFARDSAHANELAANSDFRKAVALLVDPKTPLDTVVDYALGLNWPISCAALTALKERPDGSTVAPKIATRFDGFAVWQMIFALQFLRSASPRPPAGAFLASYKDWWSDNNLLRHSLEEHFAALGDDPAELGPAVEALPLYTREQIRDFLRHVDSDAEQSCHRPDADRNRFLHGTAAQT